MDRILRNVKNRKAERSKIINYIPTKNDLKEGLSVYVITSGKLYEYIKIKNVLYRKLYEKV